MVVVVWWHTVAQWVCGRDIKPIIKIIILRGINT